MVQKDIESRSRVVSAVMKLCEWVNKVDDTDCNLKAECRRLHGDAAGLEQRWHGIWIQSVEWQVRLEDALTGNHGKHVSSSLHHYKYKAVSNLCILVEWEGFPAFQLRKTFIYKQCC